MSDGLSQSIRRPVMRYHGGKWRIAPWIISHFPAHRIYVESFGGAASVLLRKQRIGAEVYNDLDGGVVNVFRVLRDGTKAAELERRLQLTPYAREELEWSYLPADDDIDAAHKMIVRSFFGIGSDSVTRSCRTGFRSRKQDAAIMPSQSWRSYVSEFDRFTGRLLGVTIENRDAIEVMQRADGRHTLHYVDPPYVTSTRSAMSKGRASVHGYKHELTNEDHRQLAAALCGLDGMVVLSGYPSELYDELYGDWVQLRRIARADRARRRTEVLWLNPNAAAGMPQRDIFQFGGADAAGA